MSRAASELAHLFRALKAPAASRALPALAERAREEQWSYERFAEILLGTEVSSRESHGGESRIKAARFPARKTLEEFDFTFQRSVKKTLIQHLGQLDFLHGRENVVLLGPPNTPFGGGGGICGDDVVAAAMIDRLVHHAEIVALKGDSYRLRDRDLGRVPAAANTKD